MRTWRPITLFVLTWHPQIFLLLYVSFHHGLQRWTCGFLRGQAVHQKGRRSQVSVGGPCSSPLSHKHRICHHPSLGSASSASSSTHIPRAVAHPASSASMAQTSASEPGTSGWLHQPSPFSQRKRLLQLQSDYK